MKKLILTVFYLLLVQLLFARPEVGIVKENRGNIFYTDLKQIWKISPDGKSPVVVPGVHSHELSVSDFSFSSFPWPPVGGVFDDQGHHWLLESSITNDTRVRKITGKMHAPTKFVTNALNRVIQLSIGGSILLIFFLIIIKLRWSLMLKKI